MPIPSPSPLPSRWAKLIVLCAGFLMVILDSTIVNVALPSIQSDLGFSQSDLAWVVNAYLIAFGGLLLLAGRLGDLVGRKRLFLAGLLVFIGSSLLCGLATSQTMLIIARFAQGAGGATASAVVLGMIVTMFPEPAERARAIGVYSFVGAAGAVIGLLLGGILTEAISWHWIFFVNVPIGLATTLVGMRMLDHESGIGLAKGADLPGATLITGALMVGVYTILQTADSGWSATRTIVGGALSLALLVGFLARESRAQHPLIRLGIFQDRDITGANLVQMLMIGGFMGQFFIGALFFQRVLGYGPIEVGLAFLPVGIVIGLLSLVLTPRLIGRFGARAVLVAGLGAGALSLFGFSQAAHVGADYVSNLLPVMILLGISGGLSLPALVTIAMSSATPEDAGLVSGLVNTTQQVGGAVGLALLATFSAGRIADLATGGQPSAADLAGGYQLALGIAAGFVAAGLLVAIAVLRGAPETTEHASSDERAIATDG
jgi:EmrB/QacA subfamily drug resistance transporter